MHELRADDPLAVEISGAIHNGRSVVLEQLLQRHAGLAAVRIVDDRRVARTLLHVVVDWPGHRPDAARAVELLVAYGADVNAPVTHAAREGPPETPLHWAASCDDVAVLDALLDAGADIEAPGAVFTGGTPMSDAVVFAQWRAARRLLERGAKTTLWQAAALGVADEVVGAVVRVPPPLAKDVTNALWHACRGGQLSVAEVLVAAGADVNWIGHDRKTPLDVAEESGNLGLIAWLRAHGARKANGK